MVGSSRAYIFTWIDGADVPALPRLRLAIATTLLAVPLLFAACGDDDTPEGVGDGGSEETSTVTIGALLPLTGSLSSYGETSEAALQLAVEKINEDGERVKLVVEDTGTDAATVLEKIEELHDQGIKVVVGPYASSSVVAVKQYADANGIILISPLSTATSLAVADDNIFRFTPDDDKEGAAVAALAWEDGIRALIPVSRDDPGNLGLQSATKKYFEERGGKILEGITYPANETDFVDEARTLSTLLEAARTAEGEDVAIYLTAFGEVTRLFGATTGNADLEGAQWYGSDSVALSEDLVSDATAAAFAVKAGYPNPILGLIDDEEDVWGPVQEQLTEDLGRRADAFALAAYDALMVGYEALTGAGTDASIADLKEKFVSIAQEYEGLTGPTTLNDAGDRDIAIYDFWAVCADGSDFTWIRAASYVAEGDGSITRPEECS